jgi:hypothetical protein
MKEDQGKLSNYQEKLWGCELRENIPRANFAAVMKKDHGKLSNQYCGAGAARIGIILLDPEH